MYVPLIDGKCIPGDGVKTGVINSWDKGDGKKCTDVGLSPYGVIAVVLFYKDVGPPPCFF